MLKVVPPTEGKSAAAKAFGADLNAPSDTSAVLQSSDPLKTALTTSDFDEIEQLLLKNPQLVNPEFHSELQKFKPSPRSSKEAASATAPTVHSPSARKSDRSTKPDSSRGNVESKIGNIGNFKTPKGVVESEPSSSPLLPSDHWTSPAIQKRRKLTALLVASIGLILILLTIVILLVNGSDNHKTDSLVRNTTGELSGTEDLGESAESNSAGSATIEPSAPAENGTAQTLPEDNVASSTSTPVPSTSIKEQDRSASSDIEPTKDPLSELDVVDGLPDRPLGDTNDQPPPMVDSLAQPPNSLTKDLVSADEKMNSDSKPSGNTDPDELPAIPKTDSNNSVSRDELNNGLTKLDRLSQMVAGSQLSVGRFRDLASSARDEQIVGLPQYYIERNQPPPVDAAQQLAIPLSQLKYEAAPLSVVARDLMTITGVPLTLDVESIIALHGTASPKVKLEIKGVDFAQAIDALLNSAELVKRQPENGRGLVFLAANAQSFSETKFDLPELASASEDDRKAAAEELSMIIQAMIEPESWKLTENPARLTFDDNVVSIINSPTVHRQTRELLAKVNALQSATDNANESKDALHTKTETMQAKLDSPSGLTHRFPEALVDTLGSLSASTGVIVLADWEALSAEGWGPLTQIPGTLVGTTLRESLKELTQALGITYVIIDRQTILLTSFDKSVERTDLEVYSFKKLLKGKISEDQAISLLTQTLAPELNNPRIRSYYSKRQQGLFVVAPQILQEKIAKIIKAMEQL
jgi:hypothetical protein